MKGILVTVYASGAREQVERWSADVIAGAVAEGGARKQWQIRILFQILI